MSIEAVDIRPYRLPLVQPWRSHHGSMQHRTGWLICLRTKDAEGIGDCAPLPEAGTENWDEARLWLKQRGKLLIGQSPDALLEKPPPAPVAVRCGIETALVNLAAARDQISPARWLNPAAVDSIRVNANIGAIDSVGPEQLQATSGHRVIKVKLGLVSPRDEVMQLQRLLDRLPVNCRLRLDANGAWSLNQARRILSELEGLAIESIEEPLANPEIGDLRRLQQETPIPLALDESLTRFASRELLDEPPVQRWVIKPMLLGGPRSALKLAQTAHQAGIDVVVTSTVDSAIGVWAAVHLAAALGAPGQRLAHGLATSRWLAEDVAEPPRIQNGEIRLQPRNSPHEAGYQG